MAPVAHFVANILRSTSQLVFRVTGINGIDSGHPDNFRVKEPIAHAQRKQPVPVARPAVGYSAASSNETESATASGTTPAAPPAKIPFNRPIQANCTVTLNGMILEPMCAREQVR